MPKIYQIAVITLSGDPTHRLNAIFDDAIIPLIPKYDAIILLIEKVFITSDHGIGHLYHLIKKYQEKDGVFALVKPDERTIRIFTACRMQAIVPIYETEEEALKSCETKLEKKVTRLSFDAGKSPSPPKRNVNRQWTPPPTTVSIPLRLLNELRANLTPTYRGKRYSVPRENIDRITALLK